MRQEAIRTFRRSWKPKPPARPARANKSALALVRNTQAVAHDCGVSAAEPVPRVSFANPLPPPSPVALDAACRASIPDCNTGVRKRPSRDPELEALSQLVEKRKQAKAARHRVAPPPPPGLPYRQRNSREPTDPKIEILASYCVPPVPAQMRGREAWLDVRSDWIEELSDRERDDALTSADEVSLPEFEHSQTRWPRSVVWAVALIACAIYCVGWISVAADREPAAQGARSHLTIAAPTPAVAPALPPREVSLPALPAAPATPLSAVPALTAGMLAGVPSLTIEVEPTVQTIGEIRLEAAATSRRAPPRRRPIRTYYDVMAREKRAPASARLARF